MDTQETIKKYGTALADDNGNINIKCKPMKETNKEINKILADVTRPLHNLDLVHHDKDKNRIGLFVSATEIEMLKNNLIEALTSISQEPKELETILAEVISAFNLGWTEYPNDPSWNANLILIKQFIRESLKQTYLTAQSQKDKELKEKIVDEVGIDKIIENHGKQCEKEDKLSNLYKRTGDEDLKLELLHELQGEYVRTAYLDGQRKIASLLKEIL